MVQEEKITIFGNATMNIAKLQPLMAQYGVTAEDFEQLSQAASLLPESYISVTMPTLNDVESATLMSRLLRRLAPEIGVIFEHPDVIEQVDFPIHEPPHQIEREAEESEQYARGSAA